MYQQITVVGNVGGDPEMRFTNGGQPVATFSVATSRSWTGQDGQRQEKTTWFRVTCWRKLAETVAEHVKKGNRVLVVGEMEAPNAYIDRNGEAKASLEITAQTVRFLTPKGEVAGEAHAAEYAPPAAGGASDEDIPF